jgi:hypothetical protein
MDPGSHVGFQISTKKTNLVEDHPVNISGKFGWNLFSGFREEDLNVYLKDIYSMSHFYFCLPWLESCIPVIFSSPGHRPCELLSWISVRPSVSFSHLNLLLWNRWTEISQTCQKCSLDGPPMNISAKFGSNLFCGFRKKDENVKFP